MKSKKLLASVLLAVAILTFNPLYPFTSPAEVAADNSTASLSLEPTMLEVPALDSVQGIGRFYVNVHLSNVQDLKWFEFTLVFDGDILAPVPGEWHGDPSNWSGGGTASGSCGYGSYVVRSYELKNSISGSGILLKFWFEPKAAGTTKIQFKEAKLRNSNGDMIPCTFTGNEVKVIPFETWVDSKYAILKGEYDELEQRYQELTLANNELEEKYSALLTDYASLDSGYASLTSEYNDLKEEHATTVAQLKLKEDKFASTKKLLHVFLSTTIVFVIATACLAKRKIKAK